MDSIRLGTAKCPTPLVLRMIPGMLGTAPATPGLGPAPGPAPPGATSRPPARRAPGACRERPPCRAPRAAGRAGSARGCLSGTGPGRSLDACLLLVFWVCGVTGAAVPCAAYQGCFFGATFSPMAVHPFLVLLKKCFSKRYHHLTSPYWTLAYPLSVEKTRDIRSYHKSQLPWRNVNGKTPGKYLKLLFGVQRAQKLNS